MKKLRTTCRSLWATIALSTALITGCQTPDLKPFADASSTLSISVKKGGELAIKPLSKTPIWVKGEQQEPGADSHPYKALEASWEIRRKAMDALLVYSASLEAISQAAAHRQENAKALVNSVQQLASSVLGFGAAFNSAGTLVVTGLETVVEIKAWHDMRRAVEAADPAIQLIARGLTNDFADLSYLFGAPLEDHILDIGKIRRPVARIEQELRKARIKQREKVAVDPGDGASGAELARLDALYATAAADLNQIESARAKIEDEIAQGKEFFENSILAVEAWAAAHAELVKAFKEQRLPNFTLLVARAEELKSIVDQLKK